MGKRNAFCYAGRCLLTELLYTHVLAGLISIWMSLLKINRMDGRAGRNDGHAASLLPLTAIPCLGSKYLLCLTRTIDELIISLTPQQWSNEIKACCCLKPHPVQWRKIGPAAFVMKIKNPRSKENNGKSFFKGCVIFLVRACLTTRIDPLVNHFLLELLIGILLLELALHVNLSTHSTHCN